MDYLVAKKQGAKFEIKDIYRIPFERVYAGEVEVKGKGKRRGKKEEIFEYVRPFEKCIKHIQSERAKYPKGTIENIL
jgi:hypothetical protein